MENSVKALYIAAGMLLGVMILGVWVYLFRQGASLGQFYEADRNTERIQAFNSQFEKYTVVTSQREALDGYSFESKGNLPSDVVTCASLAYNINRKNDYDEKNCVDVTVKIGATEYHVYSAKAQPQNKFLVGITKENARNANSFADSSCKSFYNFMKEYNNVKIVNITDPTPTPNDYSSSAETIYKYYFDVKPDGIFYNDETGKVNKIVFTAVKTNGFDTLGNGHWSENI